MDWLVKTVDIFSRIVTKYDSKNAISLDELHYNSFSTMPENFHG